MSHVTRQQYQIPISAAVCKREASRRQRLVIGDGNAALCLRNEARTSTTV